VLYEKRKEKEKLYEGMGISFQVISNIILSFCAFSTWKMAFSKLDRAHELATTFTMLPNLSLSWQASQTHLFLNKKDLHQTAQVGVKQGTLLPKLLILCILQRLPSC